MKFLELESTTGFAEDGLFYKLFIVEDFSERESVVMFKCHHALADGMSLIGLIASMQENYSKEMMYEFRPKLSCCGRLCLFFCTPLIMLRALIDIYFFLPI